MPLCALDHPRPGAANRLKPHRPRIHSAPGPYPLPGVELGDLGVRVEDTWQAMSLRATMSNIVVLEEVFIPEERAPVFNRPLPGEPWVASAPSTQWIMQKVQFVRHPPQRAGQTLLGHSVLG